MPRAPHAPITRIRLLSSQPHRARCARQKLTHRKAAPSAAQTTTPRAQSLAAQSVSAMRDTLHPAVGCAWHALRESISRRWTTQHAPPASAARNLRGQLPRARAHAPTALCTPSQQLAALLWRLALVSQAIPGPTAVHARPARKANTRRRRDPLHVLRVPVERFPVRLQARVLILSTSLNSP